MVHVIYSYYYRHLMVFITFLFSDNDIIMVDKMETYMLLGMFLYLLD